MVDKIRAAVDARTDENFVVIARCDVTDGAGESGERVGNVTGHPAFRNSARMVARWDDRFHAGKQSIGVPTDIGSGCLTHPFFLGPRTAEDLIRCRAAIADLQQVSYGWMGRAPDYKASFLGTLGGLRELHPCHGHRLAASD